MHGPGDHPGPRAHQRPSSVLAYGVPGLLQASQGHELLIEPCAPFRLDLTAWALRRRAHNTLDRWHESTYQRAELRARDALNKLLGLTVDLSGFTAMAKRDPLLSPIAERMRGVKPPRFPSVFEALINGVACQQLSLAVGIHLLNRLTQAHGRPVSDDPDGPRAFPDPEQLATVQPEQLKLHGFSLSKARTIVETAQAIVAGGLDLEAMEQLDDLAAIERLRSLRGIGRWTAEYVMLRGLGPPAHLSRR